MLAPSEDYVCCRHDTVISQSNSIRIPDTSHTLIVYVGPVTAIVVSCCDLVIDVTVTSVSPLFSSIAFN